MKSKIKVISFGRLFAGNKIRRKVGLDTDICFAWMENEEETFNYKPEIAKKMNMLYINYKVFGELMGLLSSKYPFEKERKEVIFSFLRRNNIEIIKYNNLNQLEVKRIFDRLKNESQKFKKVAGNSDYWIISIYYVAGIDTISTNNVRDFIEPCNYLNIPLEYPPIIEPGSRQDIIRMLKNIQKPRFRKKR